ncbi:MAG: hypothetical protein IJP46_04170 [Prevotella sp.]|nr:hypothetical protein [Prevotella sp.]
MNRIRSIVLAAATVVCTTVVAQKSITQQMYWVDGNTSAAQTVGPASAAGVLEDESYEIDISSLSPGPHRLTMRVKDSEGVWSVPMTRYFVVSHQAEPTVVLDRYMYWFDISAASSATVVKGELTGNTIDIDCSGLATGSHTLYWRMGDSRGVWSNRIWKTVFSYTLPASGLGSFSASTPLAVHDDLQVGYATTYADGGVWVKDVSEGVVPQNTGVLLKGTGGTKYLLTGAETEEPDLTGNALVAVVTATYVPATTGEGDEQYTNFMLSAGEFIKIAPWDAANPNDLYNNHVMPANRAYLHILTNDLETSGNAISLMWGDDETTGIGLNPVPSPKDEWNDVWYSLDGRKLSGKPVQRGIYIVNGKKVVIK